MPTFCTSSINALFVRFTVVTGMQSSLHISQSKVHAKCLMLTLILKFQLRLKKKKVRLRGTKCNYKHHTVFKGASEKQKNYKIEVA